MKDKRKASTNKIGKIIEKIGMTRRFANTERKVKFEKKEAVKGRIPI